MKLKLLLIDKTDRRAVLKRKLESAGFDVTDHEHVWGDGPMNTTNWEDVEPNCKKILSGNYDLLFIHSNNDCSSPCIQVFLKDNEKRKAVSYAGLSTGSDISIEDDNHYAFEASVNLQADASWDLKAFYDSLSKNDPNPFYNLTGLDPIKEASIHLWKCLTLLGIKIKRGIVKNSDFSEQIEAIKNNRQIKDVQEVTSKLDKFEDITISDFDNMMNDLYKELFPEIGQTK